METQSIAHKLDAKERTDDVRLNEVTPFSKMLLSEPVRKGLHEANFLYPTVIQATAIPVGKSGLDLMIKSKSGTGKTLIFSTIVLEFYRNEIRAPQSLIVAPTREIANQIKDTINAIGKYCNRFNAVCVIGGLNIKEDRKRLQLATCVVGTPGRIIHLIENEVLNISEVRIFVLDEADKLYTSRFRKDVKRIRSALPNCKQTIACSATFINNVDEEFAKTMKNPILISTDARCNLIIGVKQFVYELPEQKSNILEMESKLEGLKYVLGRIPFRQCIIFVGSQSRAKSYYNYLQKDGWSCELMSGEQDQNTRLDNFHKFREFKTRILIATDLMSRGVDSEHVNLIINLELPTDTATFLHRIGRAGRFGSLGLAINFVASKKDDIIFKKVLKGIGKNKKFLKFPDQTKKETRSVWDFTDFAEDVKHFGLYIVDDEITDLLAPLASEDNETLTSSLSDNKEKETDNVSQSEESSIDTKTFHVKSDESAFQMPNLSTAQSPVRFDYEAEIPEWVKTRPRPNPSENPNTKAESHNSSSHPLLTSNTIDDASSIAADSLLSSQQDISRYQSFLKQASAIPTLVEFLVDRYSSEDSKINPETCKKTDLFDAYAEEVLNNNKSVTETTGTLNESQLLSNKIAECKSLLVDKRTSRSPIGYLQDPYSDFTNFQPSKISNCVSEDIDKRTFILSADTPSIQQNSYSELHNNSSDLYPVTDTSSKSTEVSRKKEKEQKPAHKHKEFFEAVAKALNYSANPQLKQMLSISKTSQIEIIPCNSPSNSISFLVNPIDNVETSESSGKAENLTQEQNLDSSESQDGGNDNSSGFIERTSTLSNKSSIHNSPAVPQPFSISNVSDDEEDEDIEYEDKNKSDDDESENYDNTNEDNGDEDESTDGEEDNTDCTTNINFGNNSINSFLNTTLSHHRLPCPTPTSRWVELYWNQVTLVQEYVEFSNSTRQKRNK